MHGIIFNELKNFAREQENISPWNDILRNLKISFKHYLPIQDYPDRELLLIIGQIAKESSKDLQLLLEEFGEYITPSLLGMYKSLIKAEWKTLDLIENIEDTIHSVVRLKNPGASPPALECRRISEDEVEVIYSSQRKLCSLAKGIIKGLARHYKQNIDIEEKSCMNTGQALCIISIRLRKH